MVVVVGEDCTFKMDYSKSETLDTYNLVYSQLVIVYTQS